MDIIGREREKAVLINCYESNKSEFVAVYGRRRVGKTFLVKELFGDKFVFYSTGILGGSKGAQLQAFNYDLARYGKDKVSSANNWIEAFIQLNVIIENTEGKKVIFLDEMPWMATMHSDFLAGLDYFWNRFAGHRKDVMLIICGSAASWITDKVINNKGGLHNRLTRQILLEPFNLRETELFLASRRVPMTRYHIAETYMIFGGIPYYLGLLEPQYSLYQNVDMLYFARGAPLGNEFGNLYKSLFKNSDIYVRVIEALAKKGIGLTRNEIVAGAKITDGGSLTKILNNLSICGFIREYKAFGQKKRDSLYQLIDFFSLFDCRFRSKREGQATDFWLRYSSTQGYHIWSGISFEKLCLLHLNQIRHKLGISGVLTGAYSWRSNYGENGVQIDMVIDRNDNIINLCEIKFASGPYQIDKKLNESLGEKRMAFISSTHTRKSVQTTMITSFGLVKNSYGMEIASEVVLDNLYGYNNIE